MIIPFILMIHTDCEITISAFAIRTSIQIWFILIEKLFTFDKILVFDVSKINKF